MTRQSLPVGTIMVLHALARGHRYGFDLLQQTGLTSGTVYPALERLERLGFARSHWEDAEHARAEKRPSRRYFEITRDGKVELAAALERYKSLAPLDLEVEADPATEGAT